MASVTVAVSELTGAALDWAVAKAVGFSGTGNTMQRWTGAAKETLETVLFYDEDSENRTGTLFSPSTNWAQLGPLVDQFDVDIGRARHIDWAEGNFYAVCRNDKLIATEYGNTKSVAICRAVVAAKLGKAVEAPQELMQ